MKTFKDRSNREWTLKVTVASIDRVKAITGVDLLSDSSDDLQQVTGDLLLFGNVLFALCKPEAEKLSVSIEEFTDALAGDELQGAIDAFTEEYADFFPNPRRRQMIKTALTKARAAEDRLTGQIESMVDQVIDAAVKKASEKLSGSLPGSSASTQTP